MEVIQSGVNGVYVVKHAEEASKYAKGDAQTQYRLRMAQTVTIWDHLVTLACVIANRVEVTSNHQSLVSEPIPPHPSPQWNNSYLLKY